MIDASLLPSLYDVLTVARRGSVAAAAEGLHKTPSAVSQQVRRVEEHFGLALFERHGRGIRPTAAGQAVVQPATRLFDAAEEVYGLLAELAGSAPATVRLAISDYLGEDLLAPVMRELTAAGVPLRFEITTAHSAESVRLLERGDVDLAVITSPESHPGLVERELFRQRMLWIAAPAAAAAPPPSHRLAEQPLLRLAEGSVGRRVLEQWLAARGVHPTSTIDVPSVSLMLAYAAAGVGVGLAPALPVVGMTGRLDTEPSDIDALPVRLVLRRGYALRAPLEAFVERLVAGAERSARKLAGDRVAAVE